MRIPRRFLVGDTEWTVSYKRPIDPEGEMVTLGLTIPDYDQILIRSRLKPRYRLETFLHEFIHACEYEHGFTIPHKVIAILEVELANLITQMID